MEIRLRRICLNDLNEYRNWKLPHHEYHQLNGPYFKKLTVSEVEQEIDKLSKLLRNETIHLLPQKKLIVNERDEIVGEVSSYWKSIETNWLEIGIVIFSKSNWGKGIGQQALRLWIDDVFQSNTDIVRLGLSTWSGNYGMIALARKLGLIKEAQYRKARIVNGEYYDSVSYGILKSEWNSNI